jgi:2-polyprenyl-6-methoxyphenol hydroxylase-like FAD-dependent oxidoreductase
MNYMEKNKKIAVIGGGIAGLTFSLCMEGSGYECHIFEKNPEFGELGAAISIFPNAMFVFRELGLMDELVASGGVMTQAYLKTSSGKILSKTLPKYKLPAICIHRADFHALLRKHCKAGMNAGHRLEKAEPLPNGQIGITFDQGEAEIFDAVIGAEGIYSPLRELIIGDGKPVFRGYNIWRGICDSNFDVGYASETYGLGKRVGIVPIKEGKYGWWATYNEEFMKDDSPEGTPEKLQRLFGDWHHPIPELMKNSKNIIKNSLIDRKPKRGWSLGNMVLIGDAAHPTTPNLGQGGCMAVEGAYILSECIKKYGLSKKAYDRYETLHFPRTKSVNETSLRMGVVGQLENRVQGFLRNKAIALMPSSVTMKLIDKFFSYNVTSLSI